MVSEAGEIHPGEIFSVVNLEGAGKDGERDLLGVRSLQEEHGSRHSNVGNIHKTP